MNKRIEIVGLALTLLCAAARAQSTTITATQIQSNLSGALLPSGYFALTPVDADGNIIGFTSGAGGQVLPQTRYWAIANGAISGVVVPDTSMTVPSNVGYRVSITDTSRTPLYTFAQPIHPVGSTWSFDAWSPTETVYASPASVLQYSTIAPTGPCTAPSAYYWGSSSIALDYCLGGVWSLYAAGNSLPAGSGLVKVASGVGALAAAADVESTLGYTPLSPANNLSDVASASTARTNLGANNASNLTTGTVPGAQLLGSAGVVQAAGVVTGATATVGAFTAYTPPAQGIYRVCASYVVTAGGSTGATLEAFAGFYNDSVGHSPVLGGSAEAATVVGASGSGYGQNNCITGLFDAAKAISIGYIVGGSPATNPTYTYWYTVTQLK